jgi:hypothetical protein
LRANGRAPWARHVASKLEDDEDDMSTPARRRTRRRREGGRGEGAPTTTRRWRRRERHSAAERPPLPGGGAGDADLRRGGAQKRGRRRSRPAAAGFRVGGRWGNEGAGGGNFQPLGFWRGRGALPRAVADASDMPLRFVQNAARPKKITAPRRLPRLLERLIPSRARYTGSFFWSATYIAQA